VKRPGELRECQRSCLLIYCTMQDAPAEAVGVVLSPLAIDFATLPAKKE
jgi:hypothetical protein